MKIEKSYLCQTDTHNYKNITKDKQPNDKTIEEAVKDGLTPGEKS